ncbi:MAG: hypothetical protein SF162_00905 [bacterium]|nr:hypothetical protein [bacterium]
MSAHRPQTAQSAPKPTFEHRSVIPTTMQAMIAFHEDPAAFSKLSPPPIFAQVHRRDWRSMADAEVEFTLWFAVLPIRWIARHEPGPTPTSFIDRQVKGPVESWVHEHIFTQVAGGIELHDRLTIVHRKSGFWAIFTRLFFGTLPLRFLFIYRHLRTRMGVKRYEQTPANA